MVVPEVLENFELLVDRCTKESRLKVFLNSIQHQNEQWFYIRRCIGQYVLEKLVKYALIPTGEVERLYSFKKFEDLLIEQNLKVALKTKVLKIKIP